MNKFDQVVFDHGEPDAVELRSSLGKLIRKVITGECKMEEKHFQELKDLHKSIDDRIKGTKEKVKNTLEKKSKKDL